MKHIITALVLAGITLTAGLAHANASMICRLEIRDGNLVNACYTEEAFEEMQRAERIRRGIPLDPNMRRRQEIREEAAERRRCGGPCPQ